ncbi:EscU/YscU/HrcU family type III secretion system export apparatus switch protein [Nocardioides campestrisoli]|uniref:EscU/YscU/HrcU family type III secretion system export apparatus switch protein n=1 Tax=Nocardioides campestrisoli TaxID=2736757 RepID=UPI0015E7AB14|nr:EscU/YscU/HrcU family type III secretion system export apparatus switch protein [Nocardioides campestrisoli]
MSQGEEKTEKPTARKKKENRKEGQVPRTQELGGWASMLAVGLALPLLLGAEMRSLEKLLVSSLRAVEDPDPAVAMELLSGGLWHVAVALLALASGVMVIGVAGALAQGGFYLATKAVKPKLSKLNPIQGAKRVFGPQALWEGAKMLIKSSVVALFAYSVIRTMMPLLGGLVPIPVVLDVISQEALGLIRNVAVAGLVMAVADYAFQRRKIGKQTRMTKQEVKQEHKNTEGDPLVKSAIRSRQMAASRNRMMADVPTADVVLVNPTHVAVALRYQPERGAPVVVARGAGAVAARIREEATAHRVPLVRDVALARALHRSTQVGQEIPAELFAAVAQVLAFVISRRTRGHHGGEHRSPRHEADLPPVLAAGRRRKSSAPVVDGR